MSSLDCLLNNRGPYHPRNRWKIQKDVKGTVRGEYSDKEAWEATHNLLGALDLLLEMDRKQQKQNSEKQGR